MRAIRRITTGPAEVTATGPAALTAVLIAAVLLSACTAPPTGPGTAGAGSTPTTPAPASPATSSTAAPPQSPPPSSRPAPPPRTPTVPRDVPTIGHNTNPGEKPPVEPVTALAHTPAGAQAFAVFFIKTIDWGYATTSSTYMRHYYQPSCIECQNLSLYLDNAQRNKEYYIGGRITLLHDGSEQPDDKSHRGFTVNLSVRVGPSEVIGSSGRASNPDRAYPRLNEVLMVDTVNGSWTVTGLETR